MRSRFGLVAISAWLWAAGLPAAAQTACQQAYQQVDDMRIKAEAKIQDARDDAFGERGKEMLDCKQDSACITQVEARYQDTVLQINKREIDLNTAVKKARNDIGAGTCRRSAAEIGQFISSLADAISKVEDGTAAIITAAKSGGSKSETPKAPAAGASPSSGAAKADPTPPKPKPPTSPAAPNSAKP